MDTLPRESNVHKTIYFPSHWMLLSKKKCCLEFAHRGSIKYKISVILDKMTQADILNSIRYLSYILYKISYM